MACMLYELEVGVQLEHRAEERCSIVRSCTNVPLHKEVVRMKFVDSVMSKGITPSWVSKRVIATLKKEVSDEQGKEEKK